MNLQTFTNTILPIKNKLYRFSLRIVGNSMEAEDVVQEVFIKLWDKRDTLEQIQNIEAWCVRVTKNLSIDKVRSASRRIGSLPEGVDFTDNKIQPDRAAELSDAVATVRQLINELPDAQKMVIQLRDIEGMSYREIADELDYSMEQVKVYLHRARKTIRKQLIQSESDGL